MPPKQQLHQLVDSLPDSQTETALHVLAALNADPLTLLLAAAPDDDEPYTAEQQREDAELIRRIDSGEEQLIPDEVIRKDLGL